MKGCERGAQDVSRGEDYAPLDEILKLANVSWPVMIYKSLHYFSGNFLDLLAHLFGECFHEVHNEEWDVLKTVSHGRHGNGKHVEPVIKITAELLLRNQGS